jgi:hypothetical protein
MLMSGTAPALGYIDQTYRLVQYNGTVGWPSPYAPKRGVPTPEIDAAWDALKGKYCE